MVSAMGKILVETNPHGMRHGLHHIATIVAKKI